MKTLSGSFSGKIAHRMGGPRSWGLDLKKSERCSSVVLFQIPLNPYMDSNEGQPGPQARIETDRIGGEKILELSSVVQGYVFLQDKSVVT